MKLSHMLFFHCKCIGIASGCIVTPHILTGTMAKKKTTRKSNEPKDQLNMTEPKHFVKRLCKYFVKFLPCKMNNPENNYVVSVTICSIRG